LIFPEMESQFSERNKFEILMVSLPGLKTSTF